MKTILSLLLSIMLALFISACDSDSPEAEDSSGEDVEQVIDDNTDAGDLVEDVVDTDDTTTGRVITNDGDTVTDTYNVGSDTYAQYIYNKTGDFNITVESSGSVVTESLVSMTKTTDTNYLNELKPYTEVDGDSIDVQAFETIIWSDEQTKLLSFVINDFSEENPTTGTFSSDALYYKSGSVELFHYTSYDVEVTSVEKDGNITHIIGTIDNVVVSTPYDGNYTISVDFNMDATLYNRVFK